MKTLINRLTPILICVVLLVNFLSCSSDEKDPIPELEIPEWEKMVIMVTTTPDNLSVKLPFDGTVNCHIDWNDGTEETFTESNPVHTYTKEGTWLIKISGTVTSLYSGQLNESELSRITAVVNWGAISGLTRMNSAFEGCTELQFLPDNDSGALDKITDFNQAFAGCSKLTTISSGLFKNCEMATSFSHTFSGCSGLTEIPAGLFHHCTVTKNFIGTFQDCENLTEIPSGLFDSCTRVTDFTQTFRNCENLKEIPSGLFDNCTQIKYLLLTFSGCKNLTGESPYTLLGENKVHLYDRNGEIGGFKKPVEYIGCFQDCVNLSDFEDMPEWWK